MKNQIFSCFGFLIASTVALFSFSAFASDSYTYRVEWYQADELTCRQDAAAIARRFAAATGFVVLTAGCERPFSWKQDIVILYQSDAPARLVTTYLRTASHQGTYSSKESCEADLSSEKSLFTKKTGLSVVTDFCFPESSSSQDNEFRFVAKIDGFGVPAMQPFVFSGSVYANPEHQPKEIDQLIRESLAQISWVQNPRVHVEYAGASPRVTVKYYSTRQRALILDSAISFESMDDCHRRQTDVEALLKDFGMVGVGSFCARKEFSEVTELYHFGLNTMAYSFERTVGSFGSLAQCESALAQVIGQYSTSTGSQLVRGYCSFETQGFGAQDYAYFSKVMIAY